MTEETPPPRPSLPPTAPGDDRTIFSPQGLPPAATPPVSTWDAAAAPDEEKSVPPLVAATPAVKPRQIQVGDVLNHIFEVKRFIARGGMGEVFEGINVNSDERVAIKVILPSLAADPNVQAMFRKEARTLTRLGHPALVQYRVLAQEPTLGVFYIVTEYVDGRNVSDVLRDMDATPAELLALTRRLAEGLSAAHALGAIHRDISPDNVMLEGGRLEGAKIIDFGIAKDLDPGSATIIGDGFAGKLNYVAPEQLGDFGREIGPWTDVYSLGLVILAVATKRDVDMGGTLVDAVDKRRAGLDLSVAPPDLRPVLDYMLRANPAERARSMNDVVDFLLRGGNVAPSAPPIAKAEKPPKPPKAPKPLKEPKPPRDASAAPSKRPLYIGGGAAAVLVIGAGLYFATRPSTLPPPPIVNDTAPTVVAGGAPSTGDPASAARGALERGLPTVGCTWLDVAGVTPGDGSLTIALAGVAGEPAQAQGQIGKLLSAAGVPAANIDFDNVSPIETSECAPLEAFRQIRDPAGGHLSVAQRQFEMTKLASGEYSGQIGAKAVINFNLTDASREYALFGIEPSGKIDLLTRSREELAGGSETLGADRYRLTIDVNHKGWSGLLLLSGRKPLDAAFIAGPAGSRDVAWAQRFTRSATAGTWKAEMAWFKTVDNQPD